MSKFCTSCGAELPENAAVCAQCGAPTEAASAAQPAQPAPMTVPATATVNGEPTEAAPLSVWACLGLLALFMLPCIGLIAAIVLSFAPKSKAINNFARAAVIWIVVVSILAGIGAMIVSAIVAEAIGAVVSGIENFAKNNGVVSENGNTVDLDALFDAIEQELEDAGVSINGSISIGDGEVSFAA